MKCQWGSLCSCEWCRYSQHPRILLLPFPLHIQVPHPQPASVPPWFVTHGFRWDGVISEVGNKVLHLLCKRITVGEIKGIGALVSFTWKTVKSQRITLWYWISEIPYGFILLSSRDTLAWENWGWRVTDRGDLYTGGLGLAKKRKGCLSGRGRVAPQYRWRSSVSNIANWSGQGATGRGSCKADNYTATVEVTGLRDRRAGGRRGPGAAAGGQVLAGDAAGGARAPQSRVCASGM